MRNDTFPLNDPAGLGIFLLIARALAPAPLEADFKAGRSVANQAPQPSPSPRAHQRATDDIRPNVRPARRRIGLLERLERWFWAQQQRDIEKYLAQSADIHDLEQRMRNLERGSWHRYN